MGARQPSGWRGFGMRRRRIAQRGARRTVIGPSVKLVEFDPDAERKVVAAALFPYSSLSLDEQTGDPAQVLEALLGDRANRRQRAPRALEHAQYTFEIVANFGAYRDLHRHRMLTQDRQLLGTSLGYDLPAGLAELGMADRFQAAVEGAAAGPPDARARRRPGAGPVRRSARLPGPLVLPGEPARGVPPVRAEDHAPGAPRLQVGGAGDVPPGRRGPSAARSLRRVRRPGPWRRAGAAAVGTTN